MSTPTNRYKTVAAMARLPPSLTVQMVSKGHSPRFAARADGGHRHMCSAAVNVRIWEIPERMSKIGSTIRQVHIVRRHLRKKERKNNISAVNPKRHAKIPENCANLSRLVSGQSMSLSGMQEVVSCRKGVQYQDIVLGKGPMVQDRKKIHVKYTLRKQSATGKILDSSDMFGFRIGKGEVIQGWDIGLEGMKQGGIRHLLIPPEAGYGQKDIGAGKGGMLFFKVTLLAC